jgi:acyl-CoA reductase-like NAD-dependent aldehyde dehydrogenase
MNKKVKDQKILYSINPADGSQIAKHKYDTAEDIYKAVKKAEKAQKEWAQTSLPNRIKYIKKVRSYLVEKSDEIALAISQDNGKTRTDAMATEIVPCAMAVTYYCNNAKRFMADKKLRTGNILFMNKRSTIVQVPFGVVGIISPWNYPFSIPFSEVVMALLAGNSVILKVATETAMIGRVIKEAFDTAGLPKGVFNLVNTPGRVTGDAFIDAGVDKLFFTGSVPVGKYLMEKAAKKLMPVVLELGGNDPMIVCDDADLNMAAAGAVWAGLQNAGQSCGGVERIYVDKKVYEEFMGILKEKVETLRIGPDLDFNTDIGAITVESQVTTVKKHVKDALKKGAVIFGETKVSRELNNRFLPCTILSNVNHDMLVMTEETFGPVLGVMPFKTVDEAIELANDSDLGLTASVWSANSSKAEKIARSIQAGAVLINDHLMSHGLAETPWGGFKQSGIGRTHGEIGFNEMTRPSVIVKDIMPFRKRNFWWHPQNEMIYNGVRGVIGFLYGKGPLKRIKSFMDLMKVFFTTFKKI